MKVWKLYRPFESLCWIAEQDMSLSDEGDEEILVGLLKATFAS